MTVKEKLYSLLKDISNVYPVKAPSGTDTYIIYSLININPNITKDSTSLVDDMRYQVNCYSPTLAASDTMADDVRDALDGYFEEGFKIDFADRSDGEFDEETGLYLVMVDFYVEQWRSGELALTDYWDFEGTMT